MSDRDTHFSGFAKLLINELREKATITVMPNAAYDYVEPFIQHIIAKRAYDLVDHAIKSIEDIDVDSFNHDEIALLIPDLTEWEER